MKICILLGTLAGGGAERTAIYLTEYGIKNGWEIDIVTLTDTKFYEVPKGCNYIYLTKDSKRKNIFVRIKNAILRKYRFNKYIKENKPDILFPILFPAIIYTYGISKKIPVIGSERSGPQFLKNKLKIFIRNNLFKRCTGLIFQTQAAMDYYKQRFKFNGVVIPNAIGNAIAYEFDKPCENRENKIVAMGRLVQEKNYETLIRAFDIIYQKYKDYRLDIYGAGAKKEELIEFAKQFGSFEAINFCGANPQALRLIYNAKCYVMSSISEGMPNALMEAMAIGVPVVSTDCPNGPSELIENEENGLLVEMKNPGKMAEAIERYIIDETFANRMAKNAMQIKESNSIENIGRQYFDYFSSFIK